MLALLQRVSHAHINVNNQTISAITQGILVFIGMEKSDSEKQADRLLQRILTYRIFSDAMGKMNLSVQDIQGGILLVPQFTLAADTDSGTRPGFSPAMAPNLSNPLFAYMTDQARQRYPTVEQGIFGADMQISLCNDGPVTFLLREGK